MNREAIYQALFDKLKTATLLDGTPAFVSASRRFKVWGDVPRNDRPALRMRQRVDTYQHPVGTAAPQKVTLEAELWIYTATDAQSSEGVPACQLNDILDAIDRALTGNVFTGQQDLGGLVKDCWIEGGVVQDPGDLDGDGVVTIPVKILVPT